MIRHVVAFRLATEDPEDRSEQVRGIRARLTALVGVVPGLLGMDVEPDLGVVAGHWHLVLVSEHESPEALESYQADPRHLEAAEWTGRFVAARAVVDYRR